MGCKSHSRWVQSSGTQCHRATMAKAMDRLRGCKQFGLGCCNHRKVTPGRAVGPAQQWCLQRVCSRNLPWPTVPFHPRRPRISWLSLVLDAVDEVESSRESSESAELLEPERLVLLETLDCEHDKSDADEKMPLSLPEARAVMPPDVVADLEPVGRPTALCPTKVRAVELAKPTCASRLLDRTVADRRTLVVGTLKPTVATVLSAAAATEPRWGRVAL
jgi:hypothetical protein